MNLNYHSVGTNTQCKSPNSVLCGCTTTFRLETENLYANLIRIYLFSIKRLFTDYDWSIVVWFVFNIGVRLDTGMKR